MAQATGKMDGEKLVVFLEGRVDSGNSNEIEESINAIRSGNPHTGMTLDIEKLEYTSSAGLRVILRLAKSEKNFEVINTSPEVYEIFEMTGFSEMITVSKAYRRISTEGCEVVGVGANGKVYRIDRDTIVKEYFNPDALPDIKRERELARKAFVLGIPTAIPYDVVRVGEGYGSVFELLNSQSFAKLIVNDPDNFDHYMEMYVNLMKHIHATEVKPEDMPDMKEVALDWARFLVPYLPEDKGKKLVSLVEAVPVKHYMLHGDYHMKNVMLQNGEAILIDMDTLCQGDPIFELGSVFNAYVGFVEVEKDPEKTFLGFSIPVSYKIWNETLRLYLETDDKDRLKEVDQKSRVIGYMRLMRRLIRRKGLEKEETRAQIEFYRNSLIDLLDKTDSLSF